MYLFFIKVLTISIAVFPKTIETISFIGSLPSFLKIQYPTLNIFLSLSDRPFASELALDLYFFFVS